MRALVACLALFLAVAVLYCDGKRKKRNVDSVGGNCTYQGHEIEDGSSKRLNQPCVRVKCKGGEVDVTTCTSRSLELEERREAGKKGKGENESRRVKRDVERKKDNKDRIFPHCCETEES
uniref:Secreted protein n=1 Tax=Amblyomma cajennense TaxID=34607 RepID=A0A023FSX1_AMBCJ